MDLSRGYLREESEGGEIYRPAPVPLVVAQRSYLPAEPALPTFVKEETDEEEKSYMETKYFPVVSINEGHHHHQAAR